MLFGTICVSGYCELVKFLYICSASVLKNDLTITENAAIDNLFSSILHS